VETIDSKADKINRLEVKDQSSDSISYDSDDGKPDYNSDFE